MNDDSIIHEVLYPYPIWTVWQALTSSDAPAQWLMPNDFKPILGHRFTFQTSPMRGWNGIIECQVVALDPPHRMSCQFASLAHNEPPLAGGLSFQTLNHWPRSFFTRPFFFNRWSVVAMVVGFASCPISAANFNISSTLAPG